MRPNGQKKMDHYYAALKRSRFIWPRGPLIYQIFCIFHSIQNRLLNLTVKFIDLAQNCNLEHLKMHNRKSILFRINNSERIGKNIP